MHKPERIISDLGDSGSPYISSQTRLFPRWLGTGYGWRITVWLVKFFKCRVDRTKKHHLASAAFDQLTVLMVNSAGSI